MIKLILFSIVTFFKVVLFNHTAEKAIITLGGTVIYSSVNAQIKQPNQSQYPLVREWRLNIPFVGQTGNSLYLLPSVIALDTFNTLTLNASTYRFDSLFGQTENTNITKFAGFTAGSSNMQWISWDQMVENMGDFGAFTPSDTTFPTDVLMTTSKANEAIEQIEDNMATKQPQNDTSTTDATRYWVWQNYYPTTNPNSYISNITSLMVNTALGYTPYDASNPSGYITPSGLSTVLSNYVTTADLSTGLASKVDVWDFNWTNLSAKPNFASVATTGDYNDLINKPSIPSVYNPIAGEGIVITGSFPNQTISVDTSESTAGGSAIMYVGKANGAISSLQNGINSKEPIITSGTTSQYWRGDKTWQSLNTSSVLESTNLYFTNSRARSAISLTTTGSGAASYNSGTGVLNIPTPTGLPALGTANQLLRVNAGASSAEWFTPSFLTGNQTITLSGDVTGSGTTAITATLSNSGVSSGTYRSSVTVDAKGRVTSATNPTVNNAVSRSISNAAGSTNRYTISSTLPAFVSYSITMNFTVTALLSSSATVYLEYSIDAGSNWITVSQVTTSFGLGLALTGSNDMSLSGYIPANALVRLRPATTNSTVSFLTGQEVLY